ncbi:hypothetical protein AMC83_CH01958 [Rhizobium phaseoli]|uniref:hypothetical protein n=1 Tax=Rhizobium phaseoli TaxID=396 RepID=UPI0007EBC92F|nr:hypothetical protein [Rhizobium phaseoli]ANL71941.1 hypothetical protein AMC83_CH01958 [Rhizobium phaseoli]
MSWKEAFVALIAALEPWLEKLSLYLAGRQAQKGDDAQKSLERVEAANRAAADMRGKPFDERVQYLKRRGRVRGL